MLAGIGAVAMSAGTTLSAKNPMVGGAAMYSTRTIVQNALNSKDHTTLVAAVKAAGLVDTLSGRGPFTVFAPTNAAFSKLPAGTVETLIKPENKDTLTKVLTYHVVPGRITAGRIASLAARHHGTATLKTVEGDRCQGRRGTHHHRQCDAVQRRDPRHRHGTDAQLADDRPAGLRCRPVAAGGRMLITEANS